MEPVAKSEPADIAVEPADRRGGLGLRLVRNIGWLLGGRGITGITSIVYLGLAARGLGPDGFGMFTLILTFGQLIANIIQFQSWKGVIRFGAIHTAAREHDRLARVLGFTAMLDWGSAVLGAAIAAAAAYLVAPLFHWARPEQNQAALFSAVLLLSSGATPTGMLRLFDRFDLLTFSEAMSPIIRVIGALIAWLLGGGVNAYLIVWALASVGQMIATWASAILIHGSRVSLGRAAYRGAIKENPGLWKFMIQTSLSSSLGFFWLQAGTLAVGAVAGPATAGGFRLADRLASGIGKSTETITRALYPELARLVASNDRATLRKLVLRTTWVALSFSTLLVLICVFAGKLLIKLVAGPQFMFAQPFLVLLAISSAFILAGFALEPLHNAHGRSGRVLRVRVIGTVLYLALLGILLPTMGAKGAAIASIATSALLTGQLAWSAARMLVGPPGEREITS
ncbi:lipopolysaccharide biosynthesis protein [Sphingomonas sp.]|uniref:lipopolysaccharide biosynthesis protein n=1 Tax=Sphingomonas sp. TaxID=28214 RepID=UPI0025DE49AC|nr:lipopolysaccharide biosynthesis protein [Sphingomonas sp.]MBV9527819.1 lipopolysaccharide biosynthesis protein [Sphingomonas sp.]